jgi:hypothetical protein
MRETRNLIRIGHGILALTLVAVLAGCGTPHPAAALPEPVALRFGYYTNADALRIARDLPGNLHIVNAVVSASEDMGTISEMYLDVADRALRGRLDGRAAIQGALDEAQTQAEALFIGGQ